MDFVVLLISCFVTVFIFSFLSYYLYVLDFIREVKKYNKRCNVHEQITIPNRFKDKVNLYREFVVFKNDYILGSFYFYKRGE